MLACGPALAVAWLVGWFGKDRTLLTMWCFFIPAPAAAACLAAWLAILRAQAPRRLRAAVKVVLVLMLLKTAFVDFAWHRPARAPESAMRVVHWNTARGVRGSERLFHSLTNDRSDICLLSEAPISFNTVGLANELLGMEHIWTESGMMLLSRYPFQPMHEIALDNAHAWAARVDTPQGLLDIVAIDLISHPLLDRYAPIAELSAWLDQREPDVPVLVLGDFNTPRDALSFQPLRRRLAHAYETAGWGWPYSWPVPLPVYAIDHAWMSQRVRILDYRLKTTLMSDHRRQIMDIELQPASPAPTNPD
jgi:hypothetical protein